MKEIIAEFVLEAPIKLLSLNKAFSTLRNGRRVRSKEYSAFKKQIDLAMHDRKLEFIEFNELFNSKAHEIHAELIFRTPNLVNLDGSLSKTSGDMANMEKCLNDSIMGLKIDDSFITNWKMSKILANDYSFRLTLKIVQR